MNKLKRIGIFKPDTLVNLLNGIGIPAITIYFICMFVFPWLDGGGDWEYVQAVWDRWQSLNMGMLAFVSSIIAFNISRYNANKQRDRNFSASKAFLPAALSDLCSYFKLSSSIYTQAWDLKPNNRLDAQAPELPENYREVFRECIKYAEPDVGMYLSNILVWLQVHDTRLRSFIAQRDDANWINPDRYNIITYLYRLAELQALINNLFEFARSMNSFDSHQLGWGDFHSAYAILDVPLEHIYIDKKMNLEYFTKRAIDRSNS